MGQFQVNPVDPGPTFDVVESADSLPVKLINAKAGELAPILANYVSQRGILQMDQRTNMIILEDTPSKLKQLEKLVAKLDVKVN